MKLLESKRGLKLPKIFFITDKEDLVKIPIGVPYIYGNAEDEEMIVTLLEYQILWESAQKTGLPFNFKKLLEDNGFSLRGFSYEITEIFVNKAKSDDGWDEIVKVGESPKSSSYETETLKDYLKDSSCYVDITKLHELKIIPVWLVDNIEEAVKINIANFITYNPYMYNKKLDGCYGDITLVDPPRNLFVIDISGSIPKAVSSTTLALARHLSESFYADILITGSKSTLYTYENIHTLNVNTIYTENGMDNDQMWFKELVSSEYRVYNNVFCFGDNHNPGQTWSNAFNRGTKDIRTDDGKKLCKWKVNNLVCFHTTHHNEIPGYATWLDVEEGNITHVKDWVKYLN